MWHIVRAGAGGGCINGCCYRPKNSARPVNVAHRSPTSPGRKGNRNEKLDQGKEKASVLFRNASFNLLAKLFPLACCWEYQITPTRYLCGESWRYINSKIFWWFMNLSFVGKIMRKEAVSGSGLAVAAHQLSETWVWRSHPLHRPPKNISVAPTSKNIQE